MRPYMQPEIEKVVGIIAMAIWAISSYNLLTPSSLA